MCICIYFWQLQNSYLKNANYLLFYIKQCPFLFSFFFLFCLLVLTVAEELKLMHRSCWLIKWDILMDKGVFVNFWKIWTSKFIILRRYIGFFISFQASLHSDKTTTKSIWSYSKITNCKRLTWFSVCCMNYLLCGSFFRSRNFKPGIRFVVI